MCKSRAPFIMLQVVLLYNNTLYLAEQDESVEVCEKPCDRYVYVGDALGETAH